MISVSDQKTFDAHTAILNLFSNNGFSRREGILVLSACLAEIMANAHISNPDQFPVDKCRDIIRGFDVSALQWFEIYMDLEGE